MVQIKLIKKPGSPNSQEKDLYLKIQLNENFIDSMDAIHELLIRICGAKGTMTSKNPNTKATANVSKVGFDSMPDEYGSLHASDELIKIILKFLCISYENHANMLVNYRQLDSGESTTHVITEREEQLLNNLKSNKLIDFLHENIGI